MAAAEDRMWWYGGLHANLAQALVRAGAGSDGPVLDAGCGTGGFLARLSSGLPGLAALGLDRDPLACQVARDKSGCEVCVGSVDRLPFPDRCLSAVVSADVLCHEGVDDRAAVHEAYRCLRSGGVYVLNLPAYAWLFSDHDRAVANARRYGRADAMALLAGAGFASVRASHWNTILFPLMVAHRKLFGSAGGASDVRPYPAPIERLFRWLVGIETRWLAAGRSLPFGGSILVTGIRND